MIKTSLASIFWSRVHRFTMSTTSSMSDFDIFERTATISKTAADQIYKEDMNMRWVSPEIKSDFLFNPCVGNTFIQLKDVSAVLVPWRVFHKKPDFLHSAFHYENGQIVYSDDVNVMMNAPMLRASSLGHLDEFTQTWEVNVKSEMELDALLVRLASFPSLLSATLTKRQILGVNSEIPIILFLDSSCGCIQELVQKLSELKKTFNGRKRFSVEVDFGPSVEIWSKRVLRRDFLCVGARFCVTSGSTFNHLWDMTNVLGCLPCLICGLIGTSVYRTNRMLKYMDISRSGLEHIAIIGTKNQNAADQRLAIYKIMEWILSVPSPVCENCHQSFSKSPNNVECLKYHETFQEQQHNGICTFASMNNEKSQEDQHKVEYDYDGNEKSHSNDCFSDNSTAGTVSIISDAKHDTNNKRMVENTNARERQMFLFPCLEELNKHRAKSHFRKSNKVFQKDGFGNPNNRNIILGPLKDSPYNKTNLTCLRRLNSEQMQELHRSVLKDEMILNTQNVSNDNVSHILDTNLSSEAETSMKTPNVLYKGKHFKDMSTHETDEVFPNYINTEHEELECDEDIRVPHEPVHDRYAREFSMQHTANGHALVLPEKPSDAFFNTFDPLSHGDVLNFLACKNAKRNLAKPNDTKTPSKGKRNLPIKNQPRSQNANKQESHA